MNKETKNRTVSSVFFPHLIFVSNCFCVWWKWTLDSLGFVWWTVFMWDSVMNVAAELCWTAADIGFLIKLSSWIGGSRNFQKHFYNSGDSVWVEDIILEETIEIDNQKTKNNWGIDTYPPFLPSTISIKDVFTSFHSQTFIRKYLQLLQCNRGPGSIHCTWQSIVYIQKTTWYAPMCILYPW